MATDKVIQLRHVYRGDLKKGYYGFSRDTFWSAGLVWLRRDPASCIDYSGTLFGTVIAFGAFFVIPALSTELEGISLTVRFRDMLSWGRLASSSFSFRACSSPSSATAVTRSNC